MTKMNKIRKKILIFIIVINMIAGILPGGIIAPLISHAEPELPGEITEQTPEETTESEPEETTDYTPYTPEETTESKTEETTEPEPETTTEAEPEETTEPEEAPEPPKELKPIDELREEVRAISQLMRGAFSLEGDFQDVVTQILSKSVSGTGLYLDDERLDSGAVVSLYDEITLRYDFEIETDEILALAENLYVPFLIPIPENIALGDDTAFPFIIKVNLDGVIYVIGIAEITGGEAYITFKGDYADGVEELNFWEQELDEFIFIEYAYFELPCGISDTEDETVEIVLLPEGDDPLIIYILENQKSKHEIEKECKVYDKDSLIFTWEITYTPGAITDESDYPLTVMDTFDNSKHVFVPGSLVIERGDEKLTGSVSHIPGKTVVSYELEEYNPAPITITYQTRLADDELGYHVVNTTGYTNIYGAPDSLITNSVTLVDDNDVTLLEPVSAEIIVEGKDKVWSYKRGTQSGRIINWTVTIHTLGRDLDNLVITDDLPTGLTLTGGVTVTNLDTGTAADAIITPTTTSFGVTINEPYAEKGYTLSYSTTIDDNYFDTSYGGSFTNTAEVDFDWNHYDYNGETGTTEETKRPAAYSIGDFNVVGKSGSYNRATHEITWSVTVNPYNVDVISGTITDDLSTRGQTYVDGSFNSGNPLITLDDVSFDNKILTIDVGNIGTASYSYTFKTTVDDPAIFAGNDSYDIYNALVGRYYYNSVTFVGDIQLRVPDPTDEDPEPDPSDYVYHVTTSATGSAWVTSRMIDKSGVGFNYNTGRATWQLIINKNNMAMTNAVLTDIVPVGQTFVPGSVSITGMVVDEDYTVNYNGETIVEDDTLIIIIPEVTAQTTITYQTEINPNLSADFKNQLLVDIENSATLVHDVHPGLTESATITVENNIVDKAGSFNAEDRAISYEVNLNLNAMTFAGATITDIIPPGLQLDISSVTLWNANVDSNGNFTKTDEKFYYDDPAFSYTLNSFTLKFPDGNGRYILAYDCYITNVSLRPYKNDIRLNDTGGVDGPPAESEDEIDIGSSGTGVSSKRVKLNIVKVDNLRTGVTLPGVKFELYQKIGTSESAPEVKIMEGETDANGEISFYPLKNGNKYILREVDGVDGYDDLTSINVVKNIVDGVTVDPKVLGKNELVLTITQDGGNTEFLEVANEPQLGYIKFTKLTDRAEKGVFEPVGEDEACFRITDQTPGSDYTDETYTDEDGIVFFANLPPFGIYKVEEIITPPYHTPAAPFYVEIDVYGDSYIDDPEHSGEKIEAFGFNDDSVVENVYFRPDLIITKTKANGTTPIEDVTFELCDAEGDSFAPPVTATTDSLGKAIFYDLYGGDSYVIKEVGTPLTGYYETGKYNTGVVNQAEDYTLLWRNYEHAASLEVTKVDEMRTGVLLSGAEFELYRDNGSGTAPAGTAIATETTAANGKLTFTNLSLNQNTTALTINAEPTLLSTDYWLVETVAPTGYILDPTPKKVTLNPATGGATPRTYTYTATVTNEPIEHGLIDLIFTKYSNKSSPYTLGSPLGATLDGVSFTMTDQTTGSDLVRTATSDAGGVVTFTDIPFGTYRIHEVAPVLYHKPLVDFYVTFDDAGNCTSFNGKSNPEPGDFVIVNEIFNPSLIITKTEANGTTAISGVVFELCDSAGNSFGTPIYATTNGSGQATFTGLLGGDTYVVKEVDTPLTGYYETGEYTIGPINQSGNYTYTWKNYEHAASIEVTKVDKMRTGVKVEGATFELYDNALCTGDPVGSATTNGSGIATFANLPLTQTTPLTINTEPVLESTDYWLVEVDEADGYILNSTSSKVTLNTRTEVNRVTIENEPVTADLDFTKYTDRDSGATLAGAVFSITDQTTGSDFTQTALVTGTDGLVSFTDIPFGRYLVEEITTPDYHTTVTRFYIEIDTAGKIVRFDDLYDDGDELDGDFEVTNLIKRTTLTITKRNDLGTAMNGVEFQLYRVVEEAEIPIGSALLTNSSGIVQFTGLMGGEKYRVKEVGTPLTGYYTTGVYELTTVNPDVAYTHTWTNYAHAASIEVTKVDKMRTGVLLSGAEFELYSDNGLGTAPNLVSGLVDTQTTGADGKLTFTGLELNQDTATLTTNAEPALEETIYWLVEKTAADGYILDTTPVKVTLAGGTATAIRTQNVPVTIENDPTKHDDITLTFTKYSNKSGPYTLGDTPIEGVWFWMKDMTEGSDYELWAKSDATGEVEFTDIPFGEYEIKEVVGDGSKVSAAVEYHKSLAAFEVEFDKDGYCISFNGIDDPDESDFVVINEIYNPDLVITKTEANGTTPIEGVVFELCKSNGDSFDTPIYATTNSGGVATFTGLLGGDSYIVKEVGTPLTGYYETGEYTIGPVNQQTNYAYTWRNYAHAASLEVTKVDELRTGVKVEGAIFELRLDNDGEPGGLVGTKTTDSNGKLKFEGLTLNQNTVSLTTDSEPILAKTTYWLVETEAASGYILDITPVKVELDPAAAGAANPRTHIYTATLENTPVTVDMSFTKYTDRDPDTPIMNATFRITDQTIGSTFYLEEDSTGVVDFTNVPHGRYLMEEILTPDYHYTMTPFYLTINDEGILTEFGGLDDEDGLSGPFSVTNEIKKTTLTITKQDDGGTPLEDIAFELYRVTYPGEVETETKIGSAQTTDEFGKVTFTGLMGGETYRVKEVETPLDGYYTTGVYELTIDQPDVADNSEEERELVPYTYTWVNYRHAASVKVTKHDSMREGVLIEGAEFELYASDEEGDITGAVIDTEITDEYGEIIFTNLPINQNTTLLTTNTEPVLEETIYWLVEKTAATGYNRTEDPIELVLNPADAGEENPRTYTYEFKVENEPAHHEDTALKFTKYSNKISAYTLGNTPIEGVWFKMTDQTAGSDYELWAKSDEYGAVTFNNIPFGLYKIEEVDGDESDTPSAVEYHKYLSAFYVEFDEDGNCISFNGKASPTTGDFAIINEIYNPDLIITKIDADGTTPIEGVTFELCDDDGDSFDTPVYATTNGSGIATFGLLGGDSYIVKEVTPNGYYISGVYEIDTVDQDEDSEYTWVNYAHAASLEVTKFDAEYDTEPVNGATFALYRDDGSELAPDLVGGLIGAQTTDASGKITFNNLPLNQNTGTLTTDDEPILEETIYWLVETGKASGYELNDNPIKVTLDPTDAGEANPRTFKYTAKVTNEPEHVTITYAPLTFGSDWVGQTPDNQGGSVDIESEIITAMVEEAEGSTATEKPGYTFVGWFELGDDYENDMPIATELEFTPARVSGLNVAGSYVAVFKEDTDVTITYAPLTFDSDWTAQSPDNQGGTVSPSGAHDYAPYTGEPESTATANVGYIFMGWFYLGDDYDTDEPITTAAKLEPERVGGLNVAGSYVAVFIEDTDVTITYAPLTFGNDWSEQKPDDQGGDVSVYSESVAPYTGEPESTASVNLGYTFMGWFALGDDYDTDDPITTAAKLEPERVGGLNVAGSYVAVFIEDPDVTITYAPLTFDSGWEPQDDEFGGEVSDASESIAPATGTASGSTATEKPGYTFVGWFELGDDYDIDTPITTAAKLEPERVGGLNVAGSYVAVFKEDPDVTITYGTKTFGSGWTTQADSLGGSVDPSGAQNYAPFTGEPESTATSNSGYTFVGWFESTADFTTDTPITTAAKFEPERDGDGLNVAGSYIAVFKENSNVTITYAPLTFGNNWTAQSPDNRGGTVSGGSETLAPATDTASGSTANANAGYSFVGWFNLGDDYETTTPIETNLEFTPERVGGLNVSGDYVAVFKENSNVTITYSPLTFGSDWSEQTPDNQGGEVSITTEDVTPATGEPSSTSSANAGYTFVGWFNLGDEYDTDDPITTALKLEPEKVGGLNAAGNYVAVFQEDPDMTITYAPLTFGSDWSSQSPDNLGGTVSPSGANDYAPYTGEPESTASANSGYTFIGWFNLDDDYENDTPLTTDEEFIPERDSYGLNIAGSYVAVFKEDADVTITYAPLTFGNDWSTQSPDNKGGTVSNTNEILAPATGMALGSTATANAGYSFVGWFEFREDGNYEEASPLETNLMLIPERDSDGLNVANDYVAVFIENADVTITYAPLTFGSDWEPQTPNNQGGEVSVYSESVAPFTGNPSSTASVNLGYTFMGWFELGDDYETDTPIETELEFTPERDIYGLNAANDYVAVFKENAKVTISYAPLTFDNEWAAQEPDKGGELSKTTESIAPATGTASGSTVSVNDGYIFVGWFNLGDNYEKDTPISTNAKFVPSKNSDDLNVSGSYIAVFIESTNVTITYAPLTFDSNWEPQYPDEQGGTVERDIENMPPATGTALGSTSAANAGYSFVGWFNAGDDYENDTPVSTDEEFIPEKIDGLNVAENYIAVFIENADVTITYAPLTFGNDWSVQTPDDKGGEVSVLSELVAPFTGDPASAATVKNGYYFIGWFNLGDDYENDAPLSTDEEFIPKRDIEGLNVAGSYVAVFIENLDVTITYTAITLEIGWTEHSGEDGGIVSTGVETLPPVTGNALGSMATENSGYSFVGWFNLGDDYKNDAPLSTDEEFIPKRDSDGLNVAGSYVAVFIKIPEENPGGIEPPVIPTRRPPIVIITTESIEESEESTEPTETTEPTISETEPSIEPEETTEAATEPSALLTEPSITSEELTGTTDLSTPPTEPALDIPESTGTAEPTVSGPDDIVVLPPEIELFEYNNFEELRNNSTLLSNGWLAVDLGEDWWQIFDENGVVLGVIKLQDYENIQDYDIEFIKSKLTPISNVMTAAEYAELNKNNTTENPRDNPHTADNIIFVLFALTAICAAAAIIIKKKLWIR